MDLYKIIGVDKNATKNEIRKAYRKKATQVHPDKGGDEDQFKNLTLAHSILTDANKRTQYDQTGTYSTKPNNLEQKALQELFTLFKIEIENAATCNNISEDIIDKIKTYIKNGIKKADSEIKVAKNKKKNIDNIIKRFKYTGEKANIIDEINKEYITKLSAQINKAEDTKALGGKMLELLDGYQFDFDKNTLNAFSSSRVNSMGHIFTINL